MKKIETYVLGAVGSNCYVVSNEKNQCIIIDIADSGGRLVAEQVKERALKPLAVLLTHGHFDHCGGVMDFVEQFDINVYCHAGDVVLAGSAGKNMWNVPAKNCIVTKELHDGEKILLSDFEIDVVATPGHTEGSVCFAMENFLFTGDTLFAGSIGRVDLAGGDSKKMNESLKKLCAMEKDFDVLCGHGDGTTLSKEKSSNFYLRNL